MPVTCLSIDKRYIQDTSLVIRWAKVDGAFWYEVDVYPPIEINEDSSDEATKREWLRVTNLKPGVEYTLSVAAKNHKTYDTASVPTSVKQFTSKCCQCGGPNNFLF